MKHSGYFDVAYLPNMGTQRILNYTHNGKDKIQFDIYDNKSNLISTYICW